MEHLEFPITLPNQPKAARWLSIGVMLLIPVSIVAGLVTGTVVYSAYAFCAQLCVVALVCLPNWPWFKTEKNIEWLQIKI